jgi:hypothetical protein
MRHIVLAIVGLGLLSGCTTGVPVGNDRSVIIDGFVWETAQDVFLKANVHCQKFNRSARLNYKDPARRTYYYDCI